VGGEEELESHTVPSRVLEMSHFFIWGLVKSMEMLRESTELYANEMCNFL
jgi:hypothetical protein